MFAAAAVMVVVLAPSASAHIDPVPAEAQAGSDLSVGFTVEHGCDGSPTVRLDMRVPEGVTNPVAVPPAGWAGRVEGDVVIFEGGPQPDDQPLTFLVRMVLPTTPDTTIYFPFVQRCEVGEIRWIDIPSDGSGVELDEPAPAMRLFGPVATPPPAPTATAVPTPAPTPVAAPSPTAVAATPTPTATAAPSPIPAATATIDSDDAESDDGGSNGVFMAIAAVAVATVGGMAAMAFLRSRRRP